MALLTEKRRCKSLDAIAGYASNTTLPWCSTMHPSTAPAFMNSQQRAARSILLLENQIANLRTQRFRQVQHLAGASDDSGRENLRWMGGKPNGTPLPPLSHFSSVTSLRTALEGCVLRPRL